jgi:hypothetical protein
MPIKKGSAKVYLTSTHNTTQWDFVLKVWNQSSEHANAARRNALITKVELLGLPSPSTKLTPKSVTNRHGNDITSLWPNGNLSGDSVGFLGIAKDQSRPEPSGVYTPESMMLGVTTNLLATHHGSAPTRVRPHPS